MAIPVYEYHPFRYSYMDISEHIDHPTPGECTNGLIFANCKLRLGGVKFVLIRVIRG